MSSRGQMQECCDVLFVLTACHIQETSEMSIIKQAIGKKYFCAEYCMKEF